jgi:hypothetical protein
MIARLRCWLLDAAVKAELAALVEQATRELIDPTCIDPIRAEIAELRGLWSRTESEIVERFAADLEELEML